VPELAGAFVEYAKLEADDQRFDEAVAILETARALRPIAALSGS
jgi:hypothetical protein